MSLTKTVGLFAGTTLAISGVAFGAAEQNNTAAEIAQLKAEIAGLKAAQGEQWLTEQRASEIRGIVTDVLADADTRSSLQGSGAGAGYNGGFFMSSADGNYSMKINLLEQIRWTFNDQSNADDEQASGFENKRTRLTFSGGMVDSSWSYKIAYYLGYGSNAEFGGYNGDGEYEFGGGNFLADASVTKDFGNGFGVTVGQFKLPFSAEYGLDAGNLQFNDYSVVNTLSGTGYGQGLNLGYSADSFRVNFAYVNAIGETNENWGDINPDYAFAIRGEYKIAGNWAQFNDGQSWKGEEFGAVIGVGYANENPQDGDDSPTWFTVDATLDFGGANLALAYYTTDEVFGVETTGFTVGGGVFLSDDFELAARFENFEPDGGDDLNTMTINGNWYLAKNTAKLGLAWGYAFDAIPDLSGGGSDPSNYAGWVQSDGEDGEWFFQAQMSFNF